MRMLHVPAHARFARALWLLLAGTLLLIAACAPRSSTNTGTAAQPPQTATTSAAPPTATNPAQTGCPESTQAVNWPQPPATIAKPQQQATTVKVKVGQTFEIALPMGQKWTLQPMTGSTLKLGSPAGYGDAAQKSCIWHFTAQAQGQTTLHFEMRPLCASNEPCPRYISMFDFIVQVSG